MLVVDGSLTIGSLIKNDEHDSLAVLSAGHVSITGGNEDTDVLLYAGNQTVFNSGAHISGSVLSPVLAPQGSLVSISNDETMFNNFRAANSWRASGGEPGTSPGPGINSSRRYSSPALAAC